MIVDAFEKLIAKYNTAERCGFCWEFEAPMRISDMNESVKKSDDDDCCVRVFLTNLRFNNPNSKPNVNRTQVQRITEVATVYFLKYDDIGFNTYSEMKGHPLSESKWKRILEPLHNCIQCIDFCEVAPKLLIENISGATEIDILADNYTGWRVDVTVSYLPDNCDYVPDLPGDDDEDEILD